MSEFAEHLRKVNDRNCMDVPSLVQSEAFVDHLINILFPIKSDSNPDQVTVSRELAKCKDLLTGLLKSIRTNIPSDPEDLAEQFFNRLPELFDAMISDGDAFTRFDPAASCVEEIILCYPGFYTISVYRLAHVLYKLEIPVLPRVMMEYAHRKTGIDIHPGASIDVPFFIDHGTGIVIGETAIIGKNVKLYQGVTLGALSVEKDMAHTKRHPTIEDHVVIYAGSTILGGNTVIGHHTIVGGNTWITESILPHSVVYRHHRVVVKDSKDYNEPIDFVI